MKVQQLSIPGLSLLQTKACLVRTVRTVPFSLSSATRLSQASSCDAPVQPTAHCCLSPSTSQTARGRTQVRAWRYLPGLQTAEPQGTTCQPLSPVTPCHPPWMRMCFSSLSLEKTSPPRNRPKQRMCRIMFRIFSVATAI